MNKTPQRVPRGYLALGNFELQSSLVQNTKHHPSKKKTMLSLRNRHSRSEVIGEDSNWQTKLHIYAHSIMLRTVAAGPLPRMCFTPGMLRLLGLTILSPILPHTKDHLHKMHATCSSVSLGARGSKSPDSMPLHPRPPRLYEVVVGLFGPLVERDLRDYGGSEPDVEKAMSSGVSFLGSSNSLEQSCPAVHWNPISTSNAKQPRSRT